MNELQKIMLLTTVLAGMDAAEIKPKLKGSEAALIQFKLIKNIEELGGEAQDETVFENALHEAVQQLYNDITKA
ncbi:hypothetical protein [Lysinibacillus sp. NPDC093688]|uniref:hypothetical protein n=1 Tax=Lysinibacillus sp. NPDC093688 TaxID=3390577 RepID=UPI003D061DBE